MGVVSVSSRSGALTSAHGDEMTARDSEPLEETTGTGRRERSSTLQPQAYFVPPHLIACTKHERPALATQRDFKPSQSNIGRRHWRIVNEIITLYSIHAFLLP